MELALIAKVLLALLVFGGIAFVDDIVDLVVGQSSGIDLDVPDEE